MIPLCDWYHPVSKSLCSLYLCLSDCCKKKHFHQYINLSLYIPRKTIKHDNCIHPLFKVVSTFNHQPKLIFVAIATTGKISRAGVNYFTLNVKYTFQNLNGKFAMHPNYKIRHPKYLIHHPKFQICHPKHQVPHYNLIVNTKYTIASPTT